MTPLSIRELRRELDLTLDAFATRIGVSSKGHVSSIERGGSCSVKVALAIEDLSDGRIDAAILNADVAAVRRGVDHAATVTARLSPPETGNVDEVSGKVAA